MTKTRFRSRFTLIALIAVVFICGVSFSQAPKPEAKKPAPAPKAAPAGEEKAEKAAGDLIDINTATAELLKTCGNRRRVGLRLPGVAWKANIGTSQNIE